VIVFRRTEGLAGVRRLSNDMRGKRFDVVLNMQRHLKGVLPTVLAGAPYRIGLDREKVREGVWRFNNIYIPPGPWAHTQDLLLRFLEPLGISRPDPLEWRVSFTAEERELQRAFFSSLPEGPVVGLVLASAVVRKDWPADRLAQLADAIATRRGATVVLVGGPSERERKIAEEVLASTTCGPVSTLANDVRRMMWTVDGCDLLVSPDTGPLHLAHALDVPVVGLFGHSNPTRVGPYARFHDLVVDAYHEAGEIPDPSCTIPRHGRMERITVPQVLDRVEMAFERYLGGGGRRTRFQESET
jgi:heptosyltransferase I